MPNYIQIVVYADAIGGPFHQASGFIYIYIIKKVFLCVCVCVYIHIRKKPL